MAANETVTVPTVAVPSMPSADLIVYRFDQIDKEVSGLHTKLDRLTTTFVTHDEFTELTKTVETLSGIVKELKSKSDETKGAIRLLKGGLALLSAIGVVIGALWWTVH